VALPQTMYTKTISKKEKKKGGSSTPL